jgi:excisionase family DNA binding protein
LRKRKIIDVYTAEEVAEALKLHPYTIRRLSREGKLPAFKIGGEWRYRKEEIDQWIGQRRGAS